MTELQQRIEVLRGVFPEVFGFKWAPFTSNPLGVSGLSDDAAGVQWNAWMDHATLGAFVGVNLEGKEYDDWPIARVIIASSRRHSYSVSAIGLRTHKASTCTSAARFGRPAAG